jgi:hypothetical protein
MIKPSPWSNHGLAATNACVVFHLSGYSGFGLKLKFASRGKQVCDGDDLCVGGNVAGVWKQERWEVLNVALIREKLRVLQEQAIVRRTHDWVCEVRYADRFLLGRLPGYTPISYFYAPKLLISFFSKVTE